MDGEDSIGYGRAKRAPRVPSACQRCRRQKLKCDRERPCALCTRSGVTCISETRPKQRRRRAANRSTADSEPQPLKEASTPAGSLNMNPVTNRSAKSTPTGDHGDGLHYQHSGDRSSGWFGPNARTSSAGMTQEVSTRPLQSIRPVH